MTLFETEYGILLLKRCDPVQAAIFADWRDKIRDQLQARIILIDEAIALDCAALKVPQTRALRHAFIDATARVRNLVLVTRNGKDFQGMGVEIVNPWDAVT
jgi:predicted nucleic acid-binding protein